MRIVEQRASGIGDSDSHDDAEAPSDVLLNALRVMGLDELDTDHIAAEFRYPLIRLATSWTAAISASTLTSRRSDLRRFSGWCRDQGRSPFFSDATLADLMGRHLGFVGQAFAPGTAKRIGSNLTALAKGVGSDIAAKEAQDRKDQATRAAQKLRRDRSVQRRKTYLTVHQIQGLRVAITAKTSSSLIAVRDLAIFDTSCDLLAGRIEIVRMRLRDLNLSENTVRISGPRGSQIDRGAVFAISSRTAASIEHWLDASGISDLDELDTGTLPIFAGIMNDGQIRLGPDSIPETMAGRTVARALQRYAEPLGISGVTGHSLRRSMAHALYDAKVPEDEIVRKGRWPSLYHMREYVGIEQPIAGASEIIF